MSDYHTKFYIKLTDINPEATVRDSLRFPLEVRKAYLYVSFTLAKVILIPTFSWTTEAMELQEKVLITLFIFVLKPVQMASWASISATVASTTQAAERRSTEQYLMATMAVEGTFVEGSGKEIVLRKYSVRYLSFYNELK